jgi:preprotein translocase subunit YajC
MLEIAGIMPLAQTMNTTIGVPGSRPAIEAAAGGTTGAGAAAGGGGTVATSAADGSTAASAPASQAAGGSGGGGGGGGLLGGMFLPIILMVVVLYLFLFRGQRKDEKKRKEMIATLKKGDRVMTIGGMLASVVAVEGDEVVLKIDESANVKARYRKSSIQEVIDRDDKK